jgi:16S rRNA (guanine527-N7)-methyltransferase
MAMIPRTSAFVSFVSAFVSFVVSFFDQPMAENRDPSLRSGFRLRTPARLGRGLASLTPAERLNLPPAPGCVPMASCNHRIGESPSHPMDLSRIAELLTSYLAPAHLAPAQLVSISMYMDILARWNQKISLTAVRAPDEMVTRHFGESLFVARHLFPDASAPVPPGGTAIDVGAGAGFPGLPLKIFAPALHLTLIESQQKKAAFLREVVRALALRDVEVFAGRAEDFSGRAALVTLRAVERFDAVLPVAARLVEPASVAPGGRLALLIGAAQAERARRLLPGFSWESPATLPRSQQRILLVGANHAHHESALA